MNVLEKLSVNEDSGRPFNTRENILTALMYDDAFAGVRMNVLTGRPERDGRPWTDADSAEARIHLESEYKLSSDAKFDDAFAVLLRQRQYNPLLDRLEALRWDGVPRVDTILTRWMNAADDDYTREVCRLMFAGAVLRAFEHGCKFDFMPVLVGAQGCGKSTLVRAVSLEYYSALTTIDPQRAAEQIAGAWIVEVEELAAITDGRGRRVTPEAVKQFISAQELTYRKPYARHPETVKRTNIFIGTTNRLSFMDDVTGGRRFLPVMVGGDAERLYKDRDALEYDIEQAWAEMVAAYKAGDELASPVPRRELAQDFREAQDAAQVDDWRVGIMADWLENFDCVCVAQIVNECLQSFDKTVRPSRQLSRDIAQILVSRFGWHQSGSMRFDDYGVQKAFRRM